MNNIKADNENPTMLFAKTELLKYLKKITGKEFNINSSKAKDGLSFEIKINLQMKHDSYKIVKEYDIIKIIGGSNRGCLYGVYSFLENLGCRWPLPGVNNEFIPRLDSIDWYGTDRIQTPSINRRGMLMASRPREELINYIDFLAKNKFNFVFLYLTSNMTEELKNKIISEMEKRDMGLDYGGHWLPGLLPRDLFNEHPEYFRMENNNRVNDLNMCASSNDAIEIMAKTAQYHIDYMNSFSKPETLHLWADDIFDGGICECDKCKNLSGSDQLLKILNDLSAKIKIDESNLKIAHIAYHGSLLPPQTIKASDKLRIMYAARERCYRHPIDGCETNLRYLDYLKGNINVKKDGLEVFDYLQDLILFRFMAVPLHPIIGKDVKIYNKIGVDGVFGHAFETYSDWAYSPNAYVLGKSLWRGDEDRSDITEYCDSVYGKVSRIMEKYYDRLFEITTSAMETCEYSGFADMRFPPIQEFNKLHVDRLRLLIDDENLNDIESLLRTALNIGKEPYRTRIADQLYIWNYTKNEIKAIYYTLEANVRESQIAAKYKSNDDIPIEIIDEMISRYEILSTMLDANTKIITSAPERLKGWYGESDNGAIQERGTYGYVAAIKSRLDQWKNKKQL